MPLPSPSTSLPVRSPCRGQGRVPTTPAAHRAGLQPGLLGKRGPNRRECVHALRPRAGKQQRRLLRVTAVGVPDADSVDGTELDLGNGCRRRHVADTPRSSRRSRPGTSPDKCPDIAGRGLSRSATGATGRPRRDISAVAASGEVGSSWPVRSAQDPGPAHPASRTIVFGTGLIGVRLGRCPRGLAPGGRQ
jgi:hypothetical protein